MSIIRTSHESATHPARNNVSDAGYSTNRHREEKQETILLYSPDMDLCLSLQLYFQDRYDVITITDPELLLTTVRTFHPSLLIIDALPTQRMQDRFGSIKRERPDVRIIVFYGSHVGRDHFHQHEQSLVDVALSKPIEIEELARWMETLVRRDSPIAKFPDS